jgi:two-component system, LuxR family, sensor kinase FixL
MDSALAHEVNQPLSASGSYVRADAVGREPTIRTTMAVERMVEVSVMDSGPGVAADVREKLFRSFVTTKASGMGVGLSICRGIVEAQGGRMWLADGPGAGVDFHFTLPIADAADANSPRMTDKTPA